MTNVNSLIFLKKTATVAFKHAAAVIVCSFLTAAHTLLHFSSKAALAAAAAASWL